MRSVCSLFNLSTLPSPSCFTFTSLSKESARMGLFYFCLDGSHITFHVGVFICAQVDEWIDSLLLPVAKWLWKLNIDAYPNFKLITSSFPSPTPRQMYIASKWAHLWIPPDLHSSQSYPSAVPAFPSTLQEVESSEIALADSINAFVSLSFRWPRTMSHMDAFYPAWCTDSLLLILANWKWTQHQHQPQFLHLDNDG